MSFFAVVLGLIIVSYNELSFNLQIVKNLYFDDKNKAIETANLNYFNFLIYQVYCALVFIGCNPEWKFCQDWARATEHATKVLDLQTVVKKVQHLEKVGLAVLDEDKYFALYLQEPQNLQDEEDKC